MGAHKRICIEFRQFLFVDSSTDKCFRCFLARTQFEVESQAHKLYVQDITVDISKGPKIENHISVLRENLLNEYH